MRAITGAVVSSEPCSLQKAARSLNRFCKSAASHLPSSDCYSYLRTLTDATIQLYHFRDELGGRRQQGAANFDAHDYEDPVDGDRGHQDQESEGGMVVAADGSHHSAAGTELDLSSGKKKGKKKKKTNENQPESEGGMAVAADGSHHSAAGTELDHASGKKKDKKKKKNENKPEDRAVAPANSHVPLSPEIVTEKRKKKHSNKEILVDVKQEPSFVVEDVKQEPSFVVEDVKQEPSFVVEEELVSEKKKSKKKKEKDHVKLEENMNVVEEKIVNDSGAEQRVARTERERKKKKHEHEEGRTEVVKEENTIANGDLDIENKRKKKRVRVDIYDNGPEQVEHTKKKQKKHSGD